MLPVFAKARFEVVLKFWVVQSKMGCRYWIWGTMLLSPFDNIYFKGIIISVFLQQRFNA